MIVAEPRNLIDTRLFETLKVSLGGSNRFKSAHFDSNSYSKLRFSNDILINYYNIDIKNYFTTLTYDHKWLDNAPSDQMQKTYEMNEKQVMK